MMKPKGNSPFLVLFRLPAMGITPFSCLKKKLLIQGEKQLSIDFLLPFSPHELDHRLHMIGVRKHVNGLNLQNLVVLRHALQIPGQC